MAIRVRRRAWLSVFGALGAAAAVLLTAWPADSQIVDDGGAPSFLFADGAWANRVLGGLNKPQVEPQGVWGEVIYANARWVVIQNSQGQQFPISFDSVRQFVVRWPTQLDNVAPDAFLEITGVDIGSNQVRTNHIDVFEGTARTLVTPTMQRLFGANRVITPLDVEQMQLYGGVFPLVGNEAGIPPRIHTVGNIIGIDPLRVGVEGNNFIAVLPSPEGLDMTQVTMGSPGFVRKGDLAYYIPEAAMPKSVTVSRFILYKNMPYRAFTNN